MDGEVISRSFSNADPENGGSQGQQLLPSLPHIVLVTVNTTTTHRGRSPADTPWSDDVI